MKDGDAPLVIGGTEIPPGFRGPIDLPVGQTFAHNELAIPLQVMRGRRDGPRLFVCAAIHGDEINGVEIIRRLLQAPALKRLKGTLVAIPIVNMHGFIHQSRYLPDGRDLNRSFPGTERGSLAGRVAYTFVDEIVRKCTHGIDLHTGARHRSNFPQIRADLDDERAMAMTEAFDVPLALDAKIRDGSLRECAGDLNIPVILYEAGEALRFDEVHIRAGVRGVLNVMRSIGMLPRSRRKPVAGRLVVSDKSTWVRASESGIVRAFAALGDRVTRGDLIAMITDPLGKAEAPVYAPVNGMIIGRSNLPLAYEGSAIFHIAQYGRQVSVVEKQVEEFTEVHQPSLTNEDLPGIDEPPIS